MAKDTSSRREQACTDVWRTKKKVFSLKEIQRGVDPATKLGWCLEQRAEPASLKNSVSRETLAFEKYNYISWILQNFSAVLCLFLWCYQRAAVRLWNLALGQCYMLVPAAASCWSHSSQAVGTQQQPAARAEYIITTFLAFLHIFLLFNGRRQTF